MKRSNYLCVRYWQTLLTRWFLTLSFWNYLAPQGIILNSKYKLYKISFEAACSEVARLGRTSHLSNGWPFTNLPCYIAHPIPKTFLCFQNSKRQSSITRRRKMSVTFRSPSHQQGLVKQWQSTEPSRKQLPTNDFAQRSDLSMETCISKRTGKKCHGARDSKKRDATKECSCS